MAELSSADIGKVYDIDLLFHARQLEKEANDTEDERLAAIILMEGKSELNAMAGFCDEAVRFMGKGIVLRSTAAGILVPDKVPQVIDRLRVGIFHGFQIARERNEGVVSYHYFSRVSYFDQYPNGDDIVEMLSRAGQCCLRSPLVA